MNLLLQPTSPADAQDKLNDPIRIRVMAGLAAGALLIFGIGGWAMTAELSGAVIATGTVKVDQNLKVIQHRDGGIVADIAVREGDLVEAGQVLIRLDDVQLRAELSILGAQVIEATARQSRLYADLAGKPEIEFPAEILAHGGKAAEVMAGEKRLHESNFLNRDSQRRQLELAIDQIGQEILGLEAQRKSLAEEVVLVEEQHADLSKLLEKKLVEEVRVMEVERERLQLSGRLAEIDSSIARSRAQIGEVRLKIIDIDETARTEAQRELSEVEARLAELDERFTATEDRLSRAAIRAPISGTVNELNVFTEGGVISPAEVLATIVPADAPLRVEVRLAPNAVDQVYPGQPVRLRFTAFNNRLTPEIEGAITHVAPATTRDEVTGDSYYAGDVGISDAELAKLGDVELMPGMPVEAYLTTNEQTALAYLVKPISDQFNRALREE